MSSVEWFCCSFVLEDRIDVKQLRQFYKLMELDLKTQVQEMIQLISFEASQGKRAMCIRGLFMLLHLQQLP